MNPKRFIAKGSSPLKKAETRIKDLYDSKEEAQAMLRSIRDDLIELQQVLYADKRHSLLLVLQGMDTSGKDGLTRHVFSGINPQGVNVFSFGRPNDEELSHDYLWRCVLRLPRKGNIGVFNRSYYEEVIVVRVTPSLLENQRLPKHGKDIWKRRFKEIRNFEEHLASNGYKIVKCFLHLSKEEQKERLLARLQNKSKNWKFEEGDLTARNQWEAYQRAYDECIPATSTEENPWHIIPADDKQNARLIVANILRDAMRSLPLKYPTLEKSEKLNLKNFEKILRKR